MSERESADRHIDEAAESDEYLRLTHEKEGKGQQIASAVAQGKHEEKAEAVFFGITALGALVSGVGIVTGRLWILYIAPSIIILATVPMVVGYGKKFTELFDNESDTIIGNRIENTRFYPDHGRNSREEGND